MNYKIGGDLVLEKTMTMKAEILSLMKKSDQITLDFSETNYIGSVGLGMLVSIYKESISKDISIEKTNVNENVRKLFRITAIEELFPDQQ